MAKEKIMTIKQKALLGSKGMIPSMWEIRRDLPNSLIICSKITGQIRMIEKKRIPN